MAVVYIGIGSNIGDRERNLEKATGLLRNTEGMAVVRTSSFYETEPVGGPSQAKYYNCVVEIDTSLEPLKLLDALKMLERSMGRENSGRNFPRIIDLDILLYEGIVLKLPRLEIPHPRMSRRYFVLKGLVEIAPPIVHPITGETVAEMYEKVIREQS